MNDAQARLADQLATDLARVLGTGIVVEAIDIEGDGPAVITVACLVDGQARQVLGTGDSVVTAMGHVIRVAAELRLAGSFWHIVGPA